MLQKSICTFVTLDMLQEMTTTEIICIFSDIKILEKMSCL